MWTEFVQTDMLHLEAEEDMRTGDKERRTPGGLFFVLVRSRISPEG